MSATTSCSRCGYALGADDRFCPRCGTGRDTTGPAAASGSPWDNVLERLTPALAPRYRILRALGYGGMAAVFLAEEPRLGRRVAIKVMAPNLMVDPGLVSRFIQEARTTAQLAHPNIVTIYDVDEQQGLHYFVMAYVAGRTLGQLLGADDAPLPIPTVLSILSQAGAAVAYAHRVGIVHRDVKPGNILIDGEGDALVTDFGIAKVVDQPGLTQTGMLVGTPAYMSPEQCSTGEVTGASDQYSLAVVAYEMVAGRPPFTGTTLGVLHAHVHDAVPPLTSTRRDCPPEVDAAIMRMLEKRPEDRFPTVSDALAAMGAAPLPHGQGLRALLGRLASAVDSLTISATPPDVAVGQTLMLSAIPHDESGRRLTGRRVQWSSSDEAVATVSEAGVVQVAGAGEVTITAVCEGAHVSARLAARPGAAEPAPVDAEPWAAGVEPGIALVPSRSTLDAGEQLMVEARVTGDTTGALRRSLVWRTSDPRIAVITGDGRVSALSAGSVVITAETGGQTATAVLTVTGLEAAAVKPLPVPAEPADVAPATPAPATPAPATPAPAEPEDWRMALPATPAPAPAPAAPAAGTPAPASARAASRAPDADRRTLVRAAIAVGVVAVVVVVGLTLRGSGGKQAPARSAATTTEPGPAGPARGVSSGASAAESSGKGAPAAALAGGGQAGVSGAGGTHAAAGAAAVPPAPKARAPAEPAVAPSGRVRLAAALPTGARATLIAADGRRRVLREGGPETVPAGIYTLEVTAPAYRTARQQLEVRAGHTESVSPMLTPLAGLEGAPARSGGTASTGNTAPASGGAAGASGTKAGAAGGNAASGGTGAGAASYANSGAASSPAPTSGAAPAAGARAAEASEIRGTIETFASSLESRDMKKVQAAMAGLPAAWVTKWKPFVENTRDVRDLHVKLTGFQLLDAGATTAQVRFTTQFDYTDYRNKPQHPSHTFDATLRRSGSGWVLTSLSSRQ